MMRRTSERRAASSEQGLNRAGVPGSYLAPRDTNRPSRLESSFPCWPLAARCSLLLLLILLAACNSKEKYQNRGGGNSDRGKQLVTKYGCDSCHVIPGVKGAQGMVGPPLAHIASRQVIAGKIQNNPQTMMQWIQNPQSFDPQSAMPNMNVTPADARDMTAYLFTLK